MEQTSIVIDDINNELFLASCIDDFDKTESELLDNKIDLMLIGTTWQQDAFKEALLRKMKNLNL